MNEFNDFDVAALLAALGVFFAGLGYLLTGLSKLISIPFPAAPKKSFFGKKK